MNDEAEDSDSDEQMEELMSAVRDGNIDSVRGYIERGIPNNVNMENLLLIAIDSKSESIVRFLVDENYVNYDNVQTRYLNPLAAAASNRCLSIVKYLGIKFPHLVNLVDSDKKDPLCVAVENDDEDIVSLLVEYLHANGLASLQTDVYNPLFLSVLSENTSITKYLASKFPILVDRLIYSKNLHYYVTPLFQAVQNDNWDMIETLVDECRADATIFDQETPLTRAILNGNIDIIKYLCESFPLKLNQRDKQGENPLFFAIRQDKLEIANFIATKFQHTINIPNREGITAVFLAASLAKSDMVKILVEHGADLNIASARGMSPVSVLVHMTLLAEYSGTQQSQVAMQNSSQLLKYMADSGADMNFSFGDGDTPLVIVRKSISNFNLHQAMSTILVSLGADVNLRIDSYEQKLRTAIDACDYTKIQKLVELKADVNRCYGEYTPVHEAVRTRNKSLLVLLVKRLDADVNRFNSRGDSPLQYACLAANSGDIVLCLLQELDADLNYAPSVASCNERTGRILVSFGAKMPSEFTIMNEPMWIQVSRQWNMLQHACAAGLEQRVRHLLYQGVKITTERNPSNFANYLTLDEKKNILQILRTASGLWERDHRKLFPPATRALAERMRLCELRQDALLLTEQKSQGTDHTEHRKRPTQQRREQIRRLPSLPRDVWELIEKFLINPQHE